MVEVSTSILSFSSTTRLTPMLPSSSMVVVMSRRWGTLQMVVGPSASRVAAMMGRAAFLAPEIRISPSSTEPPVTMSLSIGDAVVRKR